MKYILQIWRSIRPFFAHVFVFFIKYRIKQANTLPLSSRNVIFAAHKGKAGDLENTYQGVLDACKQGFPIVEVDVASTKDNYLVLWHDNTINRATSGEREIVYIKYRELCECAVTPPHGGVRIMLGKLKYHCLKVSLI